MSWDELIKMVDTDKADPIVLEFVHFMLAINASMLEQNKIMAKQHDKILNFNAEVLDRLLANKEKTDADILESNIPIIFTSGDTE